MIDVGTGLAMLGIGGPIAVAIIKFMPPRNPLNGAYVKKDLCDERSRNIQDDIQEIKLMIGKIFDKLEARP